MSLEPTLLQQTLNDQFHSFPVLSQSNKGSHANLSSYFASEKGEAQTTTILNEAITNDVCCTSVCCSTEQKKTKKQMSAVQFVMKNAVCL